MDYSMLPADKCQQNQVKWDSFCIEWDTIQAIWDNLSTRMARNLLNGTTHQTAYSNF